MVRIKEKKAKGDDAFKSTHQKVGRKKLAPVTATRAEVHARSLRVDVQRAVAVEQERQKQGTTAAPAAAAAAAPSPADPAEQNRLISEALVNAVHYRAASRKAALAACLRWLQHRDNRHGLDAPVRTLQVLERSLSSLTDTDNDVRVAARANIAHIGTHTLPANPRLVPTVAMQLLRQLNIAITHADSGVRAAALELVGKLAVPEEAWWAEGETDAREAASFLRWIVRENEAAHDEVLELAHAAFPVARGTKDFGSFSAIVRAVIVAEPGVPTPLASHPRVFELLSDVAAHGATLFRELLELKNTLFGLRDKLQLAASLGHTLGVLLRYVRTRPEQAALALGGGVSVASAVSGAKTPLPRKMLQHIRASFLDAVPFTLSELCARKTHTANRLVMAIGSVATALLEIGMASAAKAAVGVVDGLLRNDDKGSTSAFAVAGLRTVLEAELPADRQAQELCRRASAELLAVLPGAFGATLQRATLATSAFTAQLASQNLAIARAAFDRGYLATANENVIMGYVKALFMARGAELHDVHRDAIVAQFAGMVVDFTTRPDTARGLPPAHLQQLAVALPSVFGVPGPDGAVMPGIALRCSQQTQFAVACAIVHAGGRLPEPWELEPRLRAASAYASAF